MRLDGSCHCGAVRFTCESPYPVPYQRCYCSICRKTAGSGGYVINIMGQTNTLRVEGEENITIFHARTENGPSTGERRFCKKCGSPLWVYDPAWPDLLHPFASAIDTDLPAPEQSTHMMLGSKANWVEPEIGPHDRTCRRYPEESIAAWHERTGNVGLETGLGRNTGGTVHE